MNNKTKKSPTGAPMGNPLKFFREGGEKIKAMFKNGGYNTPTQSLPKKYNGGPGSGMGSMYAADQAYDSMMSEAAPTVVRRKDPGSLGTPPTPEDLKNMELYNSGPANTTPYKKPERKSYVSHGNPRGKDGGMMYKKGGATKATKFAALAPPFNKATAADRIAGAKKNARKKK